MGFRAQVASWQDFAALTRRAASDEAGLRRRFWRRLLRAASIPFWKILTAHYCAFDRPRRYVKAMLVGAIVYFVLPDDLLPIRCSVLPMKPQCLRTFQGCLSHIKPEYRSGTTTVARLRDA